MKFNIPIFIIGLFWWCEETEYFGFNKSPKSVEELFCDAISFFFLALSFINFNKNDSVKFRVKK